MRVVEKRITTVVGQAITAIGHADGSHWACRNQALSELDRGNEAEETGQVSVNLHGSRDQQGDRADERARPPVLGAGAWDQNAGQGHRSPDLGWQGCSPGQT